MFVDQLQKAIASTRSYLAAGCDPVLESIPAFLRRSHSISATLDHYYEVVLAALQGSVPAVKPNIAFFEQFGIEGLKSYARLCQRARAQGLIVIGDIKRGDIGSTFQLYARAHLGPGDFEVDAITVSPYLGFDTLEVVLKECERFEKGMYVLLRTSNPGAAELQGALDDPASSTLKVARYLREEAPRLQGSCGYSGLGAVVGATYADEARRIRALLPTNLFLIPGFGAQGGTAAEAVAGFDRGLQIPFSGAGLVNSSRALFGAFGAEVVDEKTLSEAIAKRVNDLNQQLIFAQSAQNS